MEFIFNKIKDSLIQTGEKWLSNKYVVFAIMALLMVASVFDKDQKQVENDSDSSDT